MWIRDGSELKRVRELWVNDNGTLRYIYGGNITNYTGNHPYWTNSLNSDFEEQDGAVPCWNTFWSQNNAGTYLIGPTNNGRATVQIPLAATTSTFIPGTPGSDGYYIYSTETRNIFCNFTDGDDDVVTFSPGVSPRRVTGVDGIAVPWTINASGYTRTNPSPTVEEVVSDNGTVQVFRMSRTARDDGTGIVATLSRTYASEYVPPVAASEGYTQYTGYCTFQSNYELRISQNTSYSITARCVGGSTNNTTWKIGCLTGTSDGGAQFFSPGSFAFETQAYTTTDGDRTLTFTSPTGASRARPYIRIDYDSGTDNATGTLPKQFSFEWVRFA